jgi:hypothetical protein
MNPHQPNRLPVFKPELPAPAPHLTKVGRCSDCGVTAMPAANGDMKVCPHCYALLWARDYSEENRRRKEEERAAAREREHERRVQRQAIIDEKARMRKLSEQAAKEIQKSKDEETH